MNSPSAPSEKRPGIYLLYGDDGFGMAKTVQEMVSRYEDATLGDLNITRLGGKASVEEIRTAAFAMPFLVDRRSVILTEALDQLKGEKNAQSFPQLIEALPASTALILVVNTELERKDWKDFKKNHWFRKWTDSQPAGVIFSREYALPAPAQMRTWIIEETRRQSGQISPAAAVELADLVGTNTQLASQEINKLLTYVNFLRAIELDDVKELVADVAPSSIFNMVDALAEGRQQLALQLLHELMDQDDPYRVFGMIIRQFRLLLQARELIDQGNRTSIAASMKVHPFVAEKLEKQAQRFSVANLKSIFRNLLEIDEHNKKSLMDLPIDLDLFVSELSLV